METNFYKKLFKSISSIFNHSITPEIMHRIDEEVFYFEKKDCIEYLIQASNYIEELRNSLGTEHCVHARGAMGGSLVLYLLGINDLNPLKRYRTGYRYAGGWPIEEGFDLSFDIFKYEFEKHNYVLSVSYYKDSFDIEFDGKPFRFVHSDTTATLFKFFYLIPNDFKDGLVTYDNFIIKYQDIVALDEALASYTGRYNVKSFDEEVKIHALLWGVDVVENNQKIGRMELDDMICTSDDLFNILKIKIGKDRAAKICVCNSVGKKCIDSLKKYGVEDSIIKFVRNKKYMLSKSYAVIRARKLIMILAIREAEKHAK